MIGRISTDFRDGRCLHPSEAQASMKTINKQAGQEAEPQEGPDVG